MQLSKITLCLIIFGLMFSIFVANLANLISVDVNYTREDDVASVPTEMMKSVMPLGDSSKHLMWFVQVSDLHISVFHDLARISDLKTFCEKTLPVLKPSLVIASGDLTDSKERNNIGSQQFEGEWLSYRNVLDACKVQNKIPWLDIRGNHDNFNVGGIDSKYNFYRNYSEQGKAHAKSYKFELRTSGDLYTFIAIDACIDPGPRRPFNFVGLLRKEEIDNIIKFSKEAQENGSNYTIWFGHYPTSCILAQNQHDLRYIIGKNGNSYTYLCGHFHQLGGVVPNMYTLQQAGFLELELGDWKDNRMYRIVAMDHGLLSFTDVEYKSWPVVLVTNPKHALYVIPKRENLENIIQSTHIRLLAFSTVKIIELKVRINDEDWKDCRYVDGALYVAPWEPKNYLSGIHYVYVFVKDEYGRSKTIEQPFALDGSRLSFGILPRIVLMTSVSRIFQCMFGIMLIVCVVPLSILKFLHYKVQAGKLKCPNLGFGSTWIRKLWILATINRLFYPLIFYALYISVGPWSIGHLVEDHIGVVFAWGIFVNGSFLPGSFTYAYGFLQLITLQLPLTLILANLCESRLHIHMGKPRSPRSRLRTVFSQTPFVIVLLVQILFAYFFWLSYGNLAFFLGPLKTWSMFLAIWMWYQAIRLPEKCTRDAAKVWCLKDRRNLGNFNVD